MRAMHMVPVISIIMSFTAIIIESYAFIVGVGQPGILGIDGMQFMKFGIYVANASVVMSLVVYSISKIKKIPVKNSLAALILSAVVLMAPMMSVFFVMVSR